MIVKLLLFICLFGAVVYVLCCCCLCAFVCLVFVWAFVVYDFVSVIIQ